MASADRLIEVFTEAKARLVGAERDLFLAEACRDEPALKEQVLALLQAHEGAGDFLKNTQLVPPVPVLTEKPGDRIGRYKLLQKIGEGGCGVVYMAEQEEPVRRRVALKVIKLGMDTKNVIARFEAERQALALMDHPNIAKVLDAGATETGRPFFVMELVRGIKITDYCDQSQLSTVERLKLFTQVCQAIQHAHQKGIIHRDIKPSNILVTINEPGSPGCPKVIDFGIAKATTDQRLTDKTVFTAFEQFIGTPAYMSPEQAMMTNLDVDTRTDIYALGVLLYELLTGTTPFDAKDLMSAGLDAMRRIIHEQEPERPSTRLSTMLEADLTAVAKHRHSEPAKLGPLLRGDLDWIVMKALEKDRTRRYETASGLAMDVQRHLANEPITARPPGAAYRFQKMIRRNKLICAAVAAITMALVTGLVLSAWQAVRATKAEALAQDQRKLAGRNADEANAQRAVAEIETQKAKEEGRRANEQATLARRRLYAAQINLAFQSWEAGNIARTLELLEGQRPKFDQEDLRTFEWYHLYGLCQANHRVTLHGHRKTINTLTFSPDGKTLASSSDGNVKIWDVATGDEKLALKQRGIRSGMAFSPDGRILVVGGFGGGVKICDVTTGKELPVNLPDASVQKAAVFSPDGMTLVGGGYGMIKLWDTATWREKASLKVKEGEEGSLAMSPDGKKLASAGWEGDRVKLWDLTVHPPLLIREFTGRMAVAFSPDSKSLVAAQRDGQVKVYEVATGNLQADRSDRLGTVYTVAFSPDGKSVACGAQNRCAKIWNLATGEEQIYAHLGPVSSVAFSPDGNTFASGSEDGIIKLWDLARSPSAVSFPTVKGLHSPAFSPDGTTLAFTGPKASIQLFELATGKISSIPAREQQSAWLTFAPDGKTLAQLASGGPSSTVETRLNTEVRFYNVRSGQEVAAFKVPNFDFSPDGKTFATANANPPTFAQVWDLATMRPRVRLKNIPEGRMTVLTFSPDGKMLAAGGQFGCVKIWDPASGEDRAIVQENISAPHWLGWLRFAPDSKLLAVGNWDGTVKLWDVGAGQWRASLRGHTAPVNSMAFFPDGRTLVTSSQDRTLKFWDVSTGQERLTIKGHSGLRHSLAISPDGKALATATEGATIILQRATMDKEAVAFQNELNPDDPESPVAQNKAGDRLWANGYGEDAERAYRQASSRLGQLRGRFPQSNEYVEEAIYSHFAVNLVLRNSGRAGEAEPIFREAVALQKQVGTGHPDIINRLQELGQSLCNSGKPNKAEMLCREALDLHRKLLGNDHVDVANTVHGLANALHDEGKLADAEAMYREGLAIRRKRLGDEHWEVASSLSGLAFLLSKMPGRQAEVEAMCREALAIQRRIESQSELAAQSDLSFSLNILAGVLHTQGKLIEAEAVMRESITNRIKRLGNKDPDLRHSFNLLTAVLIGQSKLDEAEVAVREGLAVARQLGNEHPDVAYALRQTADILVQRGKCAEAKTLYHEAAEHADARTLNSLAWIFATSPYSELRDGPNAIAWAEKAVASTNRNEPHSLDTLAAAHAEAGQFTNAARVQQEALALLQNSEQKKDYTSRLRLYESNLPYRDDRILAARAKYLLSAGKFVEAESFARACLAMRETQLGDHWLVFNSRSMLGGSLLGQKKYADAEPFLISAYEGMKQREAGIPENGRSRMTESLQRLVQLYEATGQSEKTAEWSKKLAEFEKAEVEKKAAAPKP